MVTTAPAKVAVVHATALTTNSPVIAEPTVTTAPAVRTGFDETIT